MEPILDQWLFSRDGKNYEEVTLPHSAYVEPETITAPQMGTVYYRYSFFAENFWKDRIVSFEIGAAMQKAKIFFNGKYHFTHFGGYHKFFIPLTDDLLLGEINTLDIVLDNNPSRDMAPGKEVTHLDFCYHSGLYRDAALRVLAPMHISDPLEVSKVAGGGIFIKTENVGDDGTAELSLSCHVLHEFPATRRFEITSQVPRPDLAWIKLEISDGEGEVFVSESDKVEVRLNCDHTFTFPLIKIKDAKLWSPENPKLYTASVTLYHDGEITDLKMEKFGIRTINFTHEGFYLNGRKVFLNGTNRHMEYPFVGNAVTANLQWYDAMLIKEAGYNLVRLSHYNQDPSFLDACDHLGIMVLPAVPGWQAYHANSAFIENCFRDCRKLVRALRNRPSVIMWELSLNEAYPPSWINEEFHRITHEEYPGPMCFSAGDTWGFYEGWDVLFPCDHMRDRTKPQFLREYGDWAFGGNDSTSRAPRSASNHALLVQTWNFLWSYNRMASVPGMVGGADWCFFDYNRGYHDDLERSGSMDIYRLPKPKFYFYQSQRDDMPMVYAVLDDEMKKAVVFSNGDEVELKLNGKTIARQKPDSGDDTPYGAKGSPGWQTALPTNLDLTGGNPFNGGNVKNFKHPPFSIEDVAPLTEEDILEVVAYKEGKEVAKQLLRKPLKELAGLSVRERNKVHTPKGELVFVDIIAIDKNGTVIDNHDFNVELRVSGNAEIIGGKSVTEAGIAPYLVRLTGSDYKFSAHCAG